jgi:hypothetical protein
MTWEKNEEGYDETVAQVIRRVLKGTRRVLEGNEGELVNVLRPESVTWTWLSAYPARLLAQIWFTCLVILQVFTVNHFLNLTALLSVPLRVRAVHQ